MLYTVFVDDNFHYMDESERYKAGEFADCASAVAACKRIVDEFLATCYLENGEDEVLKQYLLFGEDPWISSDDRECRFSARDYARQRVKELAGKR
ncbi:MAG: hypothetical protein ACHP79_06175 [Terriglobales bacterium]